MLRPFNPGSTVSRAVTTASSNVALPDEAKEQIMLSTLPGDSLCFIKFGVDSSVTAALTDTPILPGAAYIFTLNPRITYVAAITPSGTATLYATIGRGE